MSPKPIHTKPKTSYPNRGPIPAEQMVDLTGRMIRKKGGLLSNLPKKNSKFISKAWDNKRIDPVLQYILDKRIFRSKIDTPSRLKKIIMDSSAITGNSRFSMEHRRGILHAYLDGYIKSLFIKHNIPRNNISSQVLLIENLRKDVGVFLSRLELTMEETKKINAKPYSEIRVTPRNERMHEIYKANAQDAFASLSLRLINIGSVAEDISAVLQEIEEGVRRGH